MEVLDWDCGSLGKRKLFPPGFRFHPTDEELLLFYLKRKMCGKRYGLDVIAETDVYKWDPEDFPGISKLKTGDRQWFFFSPKDKKYLNGARCNRATRHGYWKATGKDRTITCRSRAVGNKKTLVFYRGRAPNGERTNWVMHEYTLDEEELKQCPTPLDYVALYKVYKKSGSGPKNGEDYGALFREEDWEDDHLEVQCLIKQEDPMMRNNEISPIDNSITLDCEPKSLLKDLEEIMNQLSKESLPIDSCDAADQCKGPEVTHNTLIDHCLRDMSLPAIQPHSQKTFVRASFNFEESDRTRSQMHEAPEVTSVSDIKGRDHPLTDENFLEDFLEIDDLIPQESTRKNLDESWNRLENLLFDGFSEFDLNQEASTFAPDVGVASTFAPDVGVDELGEISQLYANGCENGDMNLISSSHSSNECGAVNYPLQPQLNNSNIRLSKDEQRCVVFTATESIQELIPSSTTGVIYENQNNDLDDHFLATKENGSNKQDGGTDSWFSSALWAFVESIPTTPASASDSAMVNRAFEHTSSFSRIRLNAKNLNLATDITSRFSGKSRIGFICSSLLGLLCAVLWMIIGTSVRVMD